MSGVGMFSCWHGTIPWKRKNKVYQHSRGAKLRDQECTSQYLVKLMKMVFQVIKEKETIEHTLLLCQCTRAVWFGSHVQWIPTNQTEAKQYTATASQIQL
ncbi:hypothetical protein PIB30_048881 [Stylosanthes scabra]|uniref:Uncharacterized protein n=1 Tax=Stylosanthes scabra TaxID=79078 RepID=A0ABU6RHG7_9FABA|nr:hypothetical protein [Stylosanthes scabra]